MMTDANVSTLVFFVNGKKIEDKNVDPEWTLLYYLRNKLRLCGTKLGCAEGGCGACTVMVSKYDRIQDKVFHLPVNACLARVCSTHGCAVTTIEGIGSTKTRLHPVQERIAKAHGSQCGFCTPGIVMSMYTVLRNMPKPSMSDLEVALQGNLCRCTGYRAIIEGFRTFTTEWEAEHGKINGVNGINGTNGVNGSNGFNGVNGDGACGMGKNCCKYKQNGHLDDEQEMLFDTTKFRPYDITQEPIFPPELKLSDKYDKDTLFFKGENAVWHRPTSLDALLTIKENHPDVKIIVGNTEVGVEVKFKNFIYPTLIDPNRVTEMTSIEVTDKGVKFGASVTLMDIENALRIQIENQPEEKTRIFKQSVDMLHWFAGKQIRSVGSIGGNIMTGSPISDMNPVLMAAEAEFELISKSGGIRVVIMNEKFFTGYRRNLVEKDEILLSVHIPYTRENQHFYAYKQARRRDDDIAIVNSAINVTFKENSYIIDDIILTFGGMAPTTVSALKTRQALIGLPWNEEALELAQKYLMEDLPLAPSAPGGMIQYRRALTLSFFFKAFLAISQKLNLRFPQIKVNERELTGIDGFHYKIPKSSQYFEIVPGTQERNDTIGRPVIHVAAHKQVAGEAVYCDDIPYFENELYMAFVSSTKAHANILSIDASEALKMKGVHAFFCAKDMTEEHNAFGPIFHDEEVFVSKTVYSHGQTIGIVLGDTQIVAQRAAKKVKVEYEELKPIILSIDDAIKHKSFYEVKRTLDIGDVDKCFMDADHVIEGDCRNGGQEQFYFETQACIVVPKKEDDEMDVYSSTQHPSELNKLISEVLRIPQNRIVVKIKRMGGGFGGKESKAALLALPAAVAARRLQRPIRVMLDRDEDMLMTGGRHPFYSKYKVAFDSDGKIIGCEIFIYNNGGYSYDLSTAVLERACLHFENSYCIPNARVRGFVCKTNLPSNTAFRGFGGPQGMFCGENIIRDVANYLKKDFVEIAEKNLYKEGDITHYKQEILYCTLDRCWKECLKSSKFYQRRKEIEIFNKNNRWKKRGISVVPTKFGIAFTVPHLNQAGAFVIVYTDGSVLLTHGGCEMGQGLHTKMIQIASRMFEIPMSKIYISETATDKVPNTSATAASASSDLNGMAVMYACQTIKDRLIPVKKKYPNINSWEELIAQAYIERISLSATGFYATPNVGYDWINQRGTPFNYYTYGTAVSEVEIDCLTGDHQVIKTDIVMDLGDSLNPALDIGQIEGGFIQGYGLFVMEEIVYLNNGAMFTRGPGAYKIPGFADIPLEFNVALLKGAPNPRAVYSSKAVGEPPLFLASSVFFAIKEACKAARTDAGINPEFKLDAPATSAKIRMACQDHLTDKLDVPEEGTYVPWNIIP